MNDELLVWTQALFGRPENMSALKIFLPRNHTQTHSEIL